MTESSTQLIDPQLFLGFPVSEELENLLNLANPHALEMFIKNGSEYLHEASHEGKRYLGKFIGKLGKVNDFALIEANIRSISSKLVDSYDFSKPSTVLFAVNEAI